MGNDSDIERRMRFFGRNTKPLPQIPPLMESIKEALDDKILLVLAICALLTIFSGVIKDPALGWI